MRIAKSRMLGRYKVLIDPEVYAGTILLLDPRSSLTTVTERETYGTDRLEVKHSSETAIMTVTNITAGACRYRHTPPDNSIHASEAPQFSDVQITNLNAALDPGEETESASDEDLENVASDDDENMGGGDDPDSEDSVGLSQCSCCHASTALMV